MSWMLSWEVIFCASDSSHLKRKVVDHGNCTWELVKDWNSVSELNLVTFCAVLNSWTLVREDDSKWGEEIVWWWQSLLVLLEAASSGREMLIVRDLQGLLFLRLPKGITEEIRVENKAGGGWTDAVPFRSQKQISSWSDKRGHSITWLLSDGSIWAEEESPAVLEQRFTVLVLPGTWAFVQGDRTGHRCAAFLQSFL